jgi:transcriptional regulator with GAF, ATPase, and Fis domain
MSILSEKFDILYELSTTVSTESDYVEALRLIRDSLKRLIPSDAVLVFLDDRDQEKLIAPNPYNALESLGEDFIISYGNPLSRELIVNKKSCLLNESQSTLIPSMKSELYIPLFSPEETVGCLYFGREHTATFSADEIKCAEHAASLITQPVERIHQHSRLKRLQASWQQVQNEYYSLLQGLPNPAAIVDIAQDTIVKANDRLCNLLDISKERLITAKFSDICSIPSLTLTKEGTEFIDKFPVEMINSQKKRIKCQVYYTPLYNRDRKLCLFLPEEGDSHTAKEDTPGVLLDSLMRIEFSSGMQTVIINLAVEVRNIVSVDYFSISLFDKEGEESISFDLSTAGVREFSDDQWRWHEIPDTGLGWVRFADTEVKQEKVDSGLPQRMPFNLPIHNSLPLIYADRYVGNCSIGRITKKPFDKEELKKLRKLAPVMAMILLTTQLHEKVEEQSGEISKLETLASYINSDIGTEALMNIISAVREVLGASHADILWLKNPDSNGLFSWMPEIIQQYLTLQQMKALLTQLEETRTPLMINSPACFIDCFLKEHPPEEPMPFFQPFVIAPIFTHDVFSACLLFVWRRDHFIQVRDIKIIEILKNYIENTSSGKRPKSWKISSPLFHMT